MSQFLYRLGRGSAHHRRKVVVGWLVLVVALFGVGKAAGGSFHDTFSVPGAESQKATDLLMETFPAEAGSSAQVVFHARSGTLTDKADAAAVAAAMKDVGALPHVIEAPDPVTTGTISADKTIAVSTVKYDEVTQDLPTTAFDSLEAATAPATRAGLQVEFGGDLPSADATSKSNGTEVIGIVAAVAILLVAFGSIIAMGLPIGTALFGLGAGIGTITLLSAFLTMPSTSTAIASMIGLGVGIDYALFIVTRHRSELHRGLTVEDAVGRAIATAGKAVVVAGSTVVIAICGLAIAGVPLVTYMGVGASIVVAVTMTAAVTLLPALIGFAGHNIDRFGIPGTKSKVEPGVVDANGKYHGWARWSHHVARHPVKYLVVSLATVLVLAAPLFSMRLGEPDAGDDPRSSTLRRSYDLLAEGFGPGFNGPLVIAVDTAGSDAKEVLPRLSKAVQDDRDVVLVAPPTTKGSTSVLEVIPKSAPQDEATSSLVRRLRTSVIPSALDDSSAQAYVGGSNATFIDLSDRIATRLPFFIGAVLALSFLLLMVVFRSILVPLKAVVMNLLSIGAAYGVIVLVFQKGWGAGLFGVNQSLPIVSFVPMFMFAILFGLSMDYEVFLLSRIREEYDANGGDNTEAVVTGITNTARVITSAALIMITVFLSFVFGAEPTIKMVGLGLATAVFVDATIVRMILVPCTMELLGPTNWWMPRWLGRILPDLDLEGTGDLPPEEYEDRAGGADRQPAADERTPEMV